MPSMSCGPFRWCPRRILYKIRTNQIAQRFPAFLRHDDIPPEFITDRDLFEAAVQGILRAGSDADVLCLFSESLRNDFDLALSTLRTIRHLRRLAGEPSFVGPILCDDPVFGVRAAEVLAVPLPNPELPQRRLRRPYDISERVRLVVPVRHRTRHGGTIRLSTLHSQEWIAPAVGLVRCVRPPPPRRGRGDSVPSSRCGQFGARARGVAPRRQRDRRRLRCSPGRDMACAAVSHPLRARIPVAVCRPPLERIRSRRPRQIELRDTANIHTGGPGGVLCGGGHSVRNETSTQVVRER